MQHGSHNTDFTCLHFSVVMSSCRVTTLGIGLMGTRSTPERRKHFLKKLFGNLASNKMNVGFSKSTMIRAPLNLKAYFAIYQITDNVFITILEIDDITLTNNET